MRAPQSEFVRWVGPILEALRELGGSGKPLDVCDLIAERQNLSDKKLEKTLKSGQTRYLQPSPLGAPVPQGKALR